MTDESADLFNFVFDCTVGEAKAIVVHNFDPLDPPKKDAVTQNQILVSRFLSHTTSLDRDSEPIWPRQL